MRFIKLICVIIVLPIMLSGCSEGLSLENQAYVLVLGVDITDNGNIRLTIQIPKLGDSGDTNASAGNKSASYLIISSEGNSYQEALEALKWSATRELNLSQIKMIVISEKSAKSSMFPSIVATIAETYHLYTAARFVICQGNAGEFINGHETILGSRLSNELDAMFDHYSELGYIPNANFAEIYYGMNSIYSDPVCIWGFSSDGNETSDTPAAAMLGSDSKLKQMTQGPSARHYLGSVVIKKGLMAEKLNADHTLFVNLITGSLKAFNYECEDQTFQLTPLERPRVKVSLIDGKAIISLKIRLSAIAQDSSTGITDIGNSIKTDVLQTIRYCQKRNIEPFGFANKAAAGFLTINEWIDFDWHRCFSEAELSVDVTVLRADC